MQVNFWLKNLNVRMVSDKVLSQYDKKEITLTDILSEAQFKIKKNH